MAICRMPREIQIGTHVAMYRSISGWAFFVNIPHLLGAQARRLPLQAILSASCLPHRDLEAPHLIKLYMN